MSDPMNRPIDPPPQESLPRKSASPLLWLLVLVALLALGWYFYNRRGIETVPPLTTPAVGTTTAPVVPEATAPARHRPTRGTGQIQPVRGSDRDPQPIARTQPDYPPQAFRNHEEGTVLVRVDVDANGTATNADVVKRSGSRDLDRAAMDAVRKWQFKPALKDGKAIASTVQVPVEFKLDRK